MSIGAKCPDFEFLAAVRSDDPDSASLAVIEDPVIEDPVVEDPVVEDPIVAGRKFADPMLADPMLADCSVSPNDCLSDPNTA